MAAAAHLGEIDQGLTIARRPWLRETAFNLPGQHHPFHRVGDLLHRIRLSDRSGYSSGSCGNGRSDDARSPFRCRCKTIL